jgi:hypothetical protein
MSDTLYQANQLRIVAEKKLAEVTKQRDELRKSLEVTFVLTVGLLYAYVDQTVPRDLKEFAVSIADSIPEKDDSPIVEDLYSAKAVIERAKGGAQ